MTSNRILGNISLAQPISFNYVFSSLFRWRSYSYYFPSFYNQDLLAKARFVIIHGHRLAASHHYALDLICQRCSELRYLSDILVNEIRNKRIQLNRTFKMHKLLQQVTSQDMLHFWKRNYIYFFLPESFFIAIGPGSGIAFGIRFVRSLKNWVWLYLFHSSTLQYSQPGPGIKGILAPVPNMAWWGWWLPLFLGSSQRLCSGDSLQLEYFEKPWGHFAQAYLISTFHSYSNVTMNNSD